MFCIFILNNIGSIYYYININLSVIIIWIVVFRYTFYFYLLRDYILITYFFIYFVVDLFYIWVITWIQKSSY